MESRRFTLSRALGVCGEGLPFVFEASQSVGMCPGYFLVWVALFLQLVSIGMHTCMKLSNEQTEEQRIYKEMLKEQESYGAMEEQAASFQAAAFQEAGAYSGYDATYATAGYDGSTGYDAAGAQYAGYPAAGSFGGAPGASVMPQPAGMPQGGSTGIDCRARAVELTGLHGSMKRHGSLLQGFLGEATDEAGANVARSLRRNSLFGDQATSPVKAAKGVPDGTVMLFTLVCLPLVLTAFAFFIMGRAAEVPAGAQRVRKSRQLTRAVVSRRERRVRVGGVAWRPASALPSRPGTTALPLVIHRVAARAGEGGSESPTDGDPEAGDELVRCWDSRVRGNELDETYPIAGQSLPPTLPVLSLSRPGSAWGMPSWSWAELAPPTSSQLPEEPPKPSRRVQARWQDDPDDGPVKNPMGVSVRLDGVLSPTPENRTVNVVRVKDGSVILRAHVSENQESSSINLLVPSDGAVDPFNSLHVGSLGDVHALLPVCGDDALTHLPEGERVGRQRGDVRYGVVRAGHAIETSQGSFVDEAFLAGWSEIPQCRCGLDAHQSTMRSKEGLELSLPLRDGITLAAQAWGLRGVSSSLHGRPLLALHGWLDNSNSFLELAPALADLGFLVVAPDWPGHGRSQHRSLDASYLATDLPWYAAEVAQELSWTRFGLLGHSMGAAAATLMAASHYPSEEALVALCCVEMLGPIARPARHSPQHLRKGLHSREKFLARQLRGVEKVYGSLEDCIQARLRTVKALPGDQRLTSLSARRLVERAVQTFEDDALGSSWRFRHDTRLNSPSPSYYSEEQVLVLLRHITVPSLLLEADPEGGHAWPRDHLWWEARKAAVKGLRCQQLPGGHHLHLDEDTAPACVEAIATFLQEQVKMQGWEEVELS
ncbi:unnamed protein product, partial [Durusdinium trenchii]